MADFDALRLAHEDKLTACKAPISLPSEVQLLILDHLVQIVLAEVCGDCPTLDAERGILWPWSYQWSLPICESPETKDDSINDALNSQSSHASLSGASLQYARHDALIRQVEHWSTTLKAQMQVCKLWHRALSTSIRDEASLSGAVAYSHALLEDLSMLRAILITDAKRNRRLKVLKTIKIIASPIGQKLTFLHYSELSFLRHYDTNNNYTVNPPVFAGLQIAGRQNDGQYLSQFLLNCCPQLKWLEWMLAAGGQVNYGVGCWPGVFVRDLQHTRLETLIVSAPIKWNSLQHLDHGYREREIDLNLFGEDNFHLTGLPALKNVGISEMRGHDMDPPLSSQHDRAKWARELTARGLKFWYGTQLWSCPGDYYQLLSCDGTETDQVIEQILQALPRPSASIN